MIEKDCKTLEEAVKVVQGLERAHKVKTARGVPGACDVIAVGGPGHARRNCAFKSGMRGICGVKGHLSPVRRNQESEGRPTSHPSQ